MELLLFLFLRSLWRNVMATMRYRDRAARISCTREYKQMLFIKTLGDTYCSQHIMHLNSSSKGQPWPLLVYIGRDFSCKVPGDTGPSPNACFLFSSFICCHPQTLNTTIAQKIISIWTLIIAYSPLLALIILPNSFNSPRPNRSCTFPKLFHFYRNREELPSVCDTPSQKHLNIYFSDIISWPNLLERYYSRDLRNQILPSSHDPLHTASSLLIMIAFSFIALLLSDNTVNSFLFQLTLSCLSLILLITHSSPRIEVRRYSR